MANGRTLRDLRSLIDAGLGMRADAISSYGHKNRNVEILAEIMDADMPPTSSAEMIKFFMRGAIPFPMLSEYGSYIIFFNPVVDAALITSWHVHEGSAQIARVRLVAGETLEGSQISARTARWTNTEAMADEIYELVSKTQSATSRPTQLYIRRVQELIGEKQHNHVTSVRRIAASAIGASEDHISCVKKMNGLGNSSRTLTIFSSKTNINYDIEDLEIVPAGGLEHNDLAILIYSSVEKPGIFFFAAADKSRNCELVSFNGLNSIGY